jgi:hypothetical protein
VTAADRDDSGTLRAITQEWLRAIAGIRSDCEAADIKPEWQPLLRDLDRLQVATLTKDGKSIVVRTPVTGQVGSIFKAAGVALPPNIRDAAAG